MQISSAQVAKIGDAIFQERLEASLRRHVTGFAALPHEIRGLFVSESTRQARSLGLTTEQAVAGYALGAAWLGVGFEEQSPLLCQLFATPVPLLRKLDAMNAWLTDRLGQTPSVASGDLAIRRSFASTTAWGTHGG